MRDNTQELDEIFNDDYFDVRVAKQAILDWHNKQIEEVLKSIYSELGHIKTVRECIDDRLAERNRLKEAK